MRYSLVFVIVSKVFVMRMICFFSVVEDRVVRQAMSKRDAPPAVHGSVFSSVVSVQNVAQERSILANAVAPAGGPTR